MNKWKKKYKKLKKKYLLLNQGSLLHCYSCGWNTIIPYEDTICLNCHYWEDKMKEKEKNPLDTSEENLKIEV
jgi:hypothetical protein